METPTKQQEDNDDSNIVKIDNKNKVNNNNLQLNSTVQSSR